MKRFVVGIVATAALVTMTRTGQAQSRTINSEMRTETATVEAIEAASRTVTLKKPDGTYVSVVAGPDIKRFAEIKIGDKVNARYYENVIVRLKQPGEKDVDTKTSSTTGSGQVMAGGTRATQRTVSATITAIDMKAPSVTFAGPNGWKYTSRVSDVAALGKVKVGEKVDVVWTEALLVALEPGK